ncbi:MAG TPA: hypothetical protein VEL68_17725 [Thermodesulfobacteriota bacterium]|nr:hypothetical protein [Thermodesulfobacteriota bacterium]
MKSRTVEELLLELDLTEEEKGKHAKLIQESLERQKRLIEYRKEGEEGVRALEIYLRTLSRALLVIHQSVQQVNDRLAGVMLQNLPESKMPRA